MRMSVQRLVVAWSQYPFMGTAPMFHWRCFAPRNLVYTRTLRVHSKTSYALKAGRCILASESIRFMTASMERTFQYQDSLPSLPVPRLDQTCDKYLESVKPHLTEVEFLHTQFLVNQFCTGIGKDLQKKLEKKAQNSRNWLKTWWEENAYLSGRYPTAPLVNIGGQIEMGEIWPPKEGTQIERAALYTHALLQIWKGLYWQKRMVDKQGSTPLCMDQFTRLFACCKIPGKEIDTIKAVFQTAPADSPRHIIVQIGGRIFSCLVLDDQLEPFPPPVIERQLQQISAEVKSKPCTHAVCSLTAADRTTWYELRERLIGLHENNKCHLDAIESSLFAVVLDEHSPITATEVAMMCVFGDCRNRWFDKAVSLLFFKSGTLGLHCDHSPFDGIVPIDESLTASRDLIKKANKVWDSCDADEVPQPHELEFIVDDVIVQGIEDAAQKYYAVANTMSAVIFEFKNFGKNVPKQHDIHPDTFVQLALQLAYFRLHGRPAPTYESAHTRMFYQGRTETVRSCTMEALRWCQIMLDPTASSESKVETFRKACSKHDRLMKNAVNGEGFDRHLLGLRLIAAEEVRVPSLFPNKDNTFSHDDDSQRSLLSGKRVLDFVFIGKMSLAIDDRSPSSFSGEGMPTPQIYLDKGWTASGGDGNFVLSTSCIGFGHALGGCAAMVQDGYGVFYSIEEHCINFHIATYNTSRVTDGAAFRESLRLSLTSMTTPLLAAKL